ncbi:MAG: hypothetical protein ACLSVD_01355 [Eggerthellaceae bacterium]
MTLSLSRRSLVAGSALVAASFAGKRRFRTRRRRNLPAASQRRRRGALPQPVPEVRSLPVGVSAGMRSHGHARGRAAQLADARDGLSPWAVRLWALRANVPHRRHSRRGRESERIGLAVIDPQRCIA